ncbi:MAG: hypothetical protein IKQ60_05555 [Candidatus Methanomethylophilaceae archaeon]|jgi:hypothetical protein|nr:hypothetical protein [Candidatus Methanomethylophilaceae archaeon]
MDDRFDMVPGSRFAVHHGEGNVTEGVFRGISALGGGVALVFELDDGTLRYVNHSSIEFMDRMGAPPAAEEPPSTIGNVYYG